MRKQVFQNHAYIVKEIDVLNYVTKSSTKAQRRKLNIGDIYINAAVCKNCCDYIRSRYSHDFKYCKCRAISVDGGSYATKRGGNVDYIIDIIEYFYDSESDKKRNSRTI